ncbi:MAG: bifunctional DNA-formamidopyrimidine glycosylase/DNA-(apurinic or apyrimidinic site) lyase [Gemmatimonadota bacterium]
MPELPEVETIVRRLRRELPGRQVARAEVLRPNAVRGSVRRFVTAVTGATIEAVERRAKFIVMRLSGRRVWVSHLRMTGKWQFIARGGAALPGYTRAVFDFEDGARLVFVDPRTLGEMEVLSAGAWRARDAALGVEPLSPAFTAEELMTRFAGSRRAIKEWLLDQTHVAGLGNIYVVEALWRARVSPRRRACHVGPVRARRLHAAIIDVLTAAVAKQGTTLGKGVTHYTDATGDPGAFYDFLQVYDREGEPCARCGTAIRRITQGQRSTYYCPGCQR